MASTPHSHRSVNLGDGWIKSSFSTGACTCVEVRHVNGVVQVRDNKALVLAGSAPIDVNVPIIEVTVADWTTALDAFRCGRATVSAGGLSITADDAHTSFRSEVSGVRLTFNESEMAAFRSGVQAGEFDPESISST